MIIFYFEKNNTSENVDFRGKQLENPWDYNDKIFSVLYFSMNMNIILVVFSYLH